MQLASFGLLACSLAGLGVAWLSACDGDEPSPNNGSGGSAEGGSGATGGSDDTTTTSTTGGMGGTSADGGSAGGGMGGAGGSQPDPLAGEYNHECLPASPGCYGGWVCKVGICDYCVDDLDCPNSDCNTSNTFRCAAHDLCSGPSDCPSNSMCDGVSCVYDHPSQGVCGVDALYFAHDTTSLTPTYSARFTGAVACLVAEINAGNPLTIEVFNDNIGSPGYNVPLTQSRGNALKNYLVSQGASAASITVVAHGASQSTGIYEADRAADRRAEFNW